MARFQPHLVEELWSFRCADGRVHASIWTHPENYELRVLWDGVLAWSRACTDLAEVQATAAETKSRVERTGRAGLF
ncbi:MAG: hypothetical protein ABIT71_26575 [Vicinamibacteraceae bacterium]